MRTMVMVMILNMTAMKMTTIVTRIRCDDACARRTKMLMVVVMGMILKITAMTMTTIVTRRKTTMTLIS